MKICPFRSTADKTVQCDSNCALFCVPNNVTQPTACAFMRLAQSLQKIETYFLLTHGDISELKDIIAGK